MPNGLPATISMKAFFKDIFAYHFHFNQKLAIVFLENEKNLTPRTLPLFSHCLNAHQIWNSRILNTLPFGVHQVHEISNFQAIDLSNYQNTLKIIDTFDFAETITYKNSKGDTFSNSVRTILFHIANHHTHHKGQLISDLRQQGIEPLVTDYIFYKR